MAAGFSQGLKSIRSTQFMEVTSSLVGVVFGGIAEVVTSSDYSLMRRVNRWPAPRWFQLWMLGSTRIGDGWLWGFLAAAIALWGGSRRFDALEVSLTAGLTGCALFMLLKRACGRRRPCHIMPHCWAQLLPPDQFSFPSGHTITAFAVAVSLGPFYPALAPALFFTAASIAASRILLGMHFLSDVLAGAAIGTVLAKLTLVVVS